MSNPVPPSKRKKRTEDDELLDEIYGPKTRALRETLAAPHKYGKPKVNEGDETFGSRLNKRIKRITGG